MLSHAVMPLRPRSTAHNTVVYAAGRVMVFEGNPPSHKTRFFFRVLRKSGTLPHTLEGTRTVLNKNTMMEKKKDTFEARCGVIEVSVLFV
jgi:hypothetical protein